MTHYLYTLLHLFHPAGVAPVRVNQTQSDSHVHPTYSAGDRPAKEIVQMNKKLVLTVLIVLASLTLAACAPRVTSRLLSAEEGATYAAEVDEIVDNMIVGFCENDFDKLTRDMPNRLTKDYKDSVRQTAEIINREFGAYQGKTLDHVEDRGRFRVVIYHVVFENEPDVTLSVMFNAKSHIIYGTNWALK